MPDDNWHLSKSVPLTLIFGLVVQGAAIVWTVSMMMSDIDRNSAAITTLDFRVEKIEDLVQSQAIAMARIDENIKQIRKSVELMANRSPQ